MAGIRYIVKVKDIYLPISGRINLKINTKFIIENVCVCVYVIYVTFFINWKHCVQTDQSQRLVNKNVDSTIKSNIILIGSDIIE